ncbi:GntR family transcriptional regulator [Luteolibacter algae]|uniref:GntR family transcriptional regulator n=1 Tax=Luteolibacter algae TaxID=454151 RepID=A0ABW5DAW0_9BACT
MSNNIAPIKTIREQIAGHLRADILSGNFPKGYPLREQPLAERFGVSRGPIRDVLLQLTQEGMLVSVPNCGVRVSGEPSEWVQPLIVKVRVEIETFALRNSIHKIGPAQIAEMERLIAKLGEACERRDIAKIAELDIAFHQALLKCAGDEEIVSMWVPIVTRMIMHYSRHKDISQSHEEHIAILQAVRDKDLERAITALEANIQ